MSIVIWWIRRDLRLADNPTLQAALERGRPVVPVFIFDPHLVKMAPSIRLNFLFAGLQSLDEALRARGSKLILRQGDPYQVLQKLKDEFELDGIYAEEDFSPYAIRRDRSIASNLPFHLVSGLTIRHPASILKPDGRPYAVFTPFSRTWKALPFPSQRNILPAPMILPFPGDIHSEPLPDFLTSDLFPAGESEALRRLNTFLSEPLFQYTDDRNRMDHDGTSILSPYFRFGMLSVRQAAAAAQAARDAQETVSDSKAVETWINELVWREFYISILYHFPQVLRMAFNPGLRKIQWRQSTQDLLAWQEGRTGYPVVDAAMRQLQQTGWMHNRARMIVASFLVKDLLINWQEGERWFMDHLIDGDPAANNGGWQWTAGVGTDAAPYFRIFNPVLQSTRFDPQGSYIRRWIPELQNVPTGSIHQPWRMTPDEQRKYGCKIGLNYPDPMVDRTQVKNRVLEAYRLSQEMFKAQT